MGFVLTEAGRRKVKNGTGSRGLNLAHKVQLDKIENSFVAKWPTPGSYGFSNEGQGAKISAKAADYAEAVAMTDGRKSVVNRYWKGNRNKIIGGQLNADWVSILMGFPVDWTVVEDGNVESLE